MTTPEDTELYNSLIRMPVTTNQGGVVLMSDDQVKDFTNLITLHTQKAVQLAESAATQTKEDKFETDIRDAINRHSKENGSNTPDFVLAAYLVACLKNFDYFTRYRDSTNPTEAGEL